MTVLDRSCGERHKNASVLADRARRCSVRRMLLFALASGLTVASLGCATALNMQDATLRKPYGGVTMPILDFFGNTESSEAAALLFWPVWLIDKPLELVRRHDHTAVPSLCAVGYPTSCAEPESAACSAIALNGLSSSGFTIRPHGIAFISFNSAFNRLTVWA